ncbi:MAG TPA: NAD-dependent epimerase/dehydratase family protein [Steroidobacteraceae bacterium]|jgi:CDP-paratose 2-epimerase|nr:NAD-dependent epimerase/dehydratase family protein [Steroidobacteraceae bacterium]
MTDARPVLITGGAGFIGTNLADRLLRAGRDVLVFDNLSRRGVQANLDWLWEQHPEHLSVEIADIRDADAVAAAVARASEVYHLAAQVAVTSSLTDPRTDFEINARGTLNVLETMRQLTDPPPLLFTSTNKVYGALADVQLEVSAERCMPADATLRAQGVDETRPLEFHSPYGCSKGAAEQYVLDYARSFDLRTIVFRMSCIYGPHQQGNEDQGWVAHFMKRARERGTLNIYGDGLQVRDLLYVEDLLDAFQLAMRNAERLAGQAFNIGGGPLNTLSLRELIARLQERSGGQPPRVQYGRARRGDQRYYVSNTGAFSAATGWRPRMTVAQGLERLGKWLDASAAASASAGPPPMVAAR